MSENPNIIALREFRLKGRKVYEGEVVAKSEFANSGEWQNLCHMKPARAAETAEKVGKPSKDKVAKTDPAKLPGV